MSTTTGNNKKTKASKAATADPTPKTTDPKTKAPTERVALKVKETHPNLPSKMKSMFVGILWFLDPVNIATLAAENSEMDDNEIAELVHATTAVRDLLPVYLPAEDQISFFTPAIDVPALFKKYVKVPVAERKKEATAQRKRDIAAEKAAARAAAGKATRKPRKSAAAPAPVTEPEPEPESEPETDAGTKVLDEEDSVADSVTFTQLREAATSQKSFEEDTADAYSEAEKASAEVEPSPAPAPAPAPVKEKKPRKPRAPAAKKGARVENVY